MEGRLGLGGDTETEDTGGNRGNEIEVRGAGEPGGQEESEVGERESEVGDSALGMLSCVGRRIL